MKKRWLVLLLCVICAVFGVCFAGCNNGEDVPPEPVVITIADATEGETLLEYMEDMQEDGKLSYTVTDGMLQKLNGVSNTTNCYWMLYTSDADNADKSWGTYNFYGQDLGSATLGCESLTVKNGCVYVWVYTKF